MNLPERRDSRAEASDPKPGLRPRPIQTREGEVTGADREGVMHFSCPSCLRMISAAKGSGALVCAQCEARVMPPQLVTDRAASGHLPTPTKTGRLK